MKKLLITFLALIPFLFSCKNNQEEKKVEDMTDEELIEQKKTLEKEIEIRQFKQLIKLLKII